VGQTPRDWWYLGPEHGQHIGFFRRQTLQHLARSLGAHVASDGERVHLFSRRPVPVLWRLLLRFPTVAQLVARVSLKSRTMTDFDVLRAGSLGKGP
jgi:hypothetical protein